MSLTQPMDLLGCPRCKERFVLSDAGTGEGWACRTCRAELRVIGRGVPRWLAPEDFKPNHLNRLSRSLVSPAFRNR